MSEAQLITLSAENLGKRYNREWIFRQLHGKWTSGEMIGIQGPNGSGKSTLMRALSGFESPSAGVITWTKGDQIIPRSTVYRNVSIAAPYTEIIEELTLREFVAFHFRFKKLLPSWSVSRFLDHLQLGRASDRAINAYSSGMKQRVKLLAALASDTDMVFLDEPTTNLDVAGKKWFQDLLAETAMNRLVFIASNEEGDFMQCTNQLSILDYKQR